VQPRQRRGDLGGDLVPAGISRGDGPTTPMGSRTMSEVPSPLRVESVANWAAVAKLITGRPTWMRWTG